MNKRQYNNKTITPENPIKENIYGGVLLFQIGCTDLHLLFIMLMKCLFGIILL